MRSALAPAGEPGETLPGLAVVDAAVEGWLRRLDPVHGGVRGAPKFPSSMPVRLLLRHHRRTGDARSLDAAVRTLDGMADGGIHDQLGGGFHRYSTDERWLVPHFEKMLYDNALLILAYAEGWQVTGSESWARVTRDMAEMVLRDFSAPDGGFASASDADSEGEEGRAFAWTEAEIGALLGDAAGRLGPLPRGSRGGQLGRRERAARATAGRGGVAGAGRVAPASCSRPGGGASSRCGTTRCWPAGTA